MSGGKKDTTLRNNRKALNRHLAGELSPQQFRDELTKNGTGPISRERLMKSAEKLRKLRKLGVRINA